MWDAQGETRPAECVGHPFHVLDQRFGATDDALPRGVLTGQYQVGMVNQPGERLRPAAVHTDREHLSVPALPGQYLGPGHGQARGVLHGQVSRGGQGPQLSDALPDDRERPGAFGDEHVVRRDADREDLQILHLRAALVTRLVRLNQPCADVGQPHFPGRFVDAGQCFTHGLVAVIEIAQDSSAWRSHRTGHDKDRIHHVHHPYLCPDCWRIRMASRGPETHTTARRNTSPCIVMPGRWARKNAPLAAPR